MTKRGEKIKYYKARLDKLLKNEPLASDVEERYRSIRYTLLETYPNLIGSVSKETMCEFLRDVTFVDRLLRRQTEGKQNKLKTVLSQEFQIENLGYTPGHLQDSKILENL